MPCGSLSQPWSACIHPGLSKAGALPGLQGVFTLNPESECQQAPPVQAGSRGQVRRFTCSPRGVRVALGTWSPLPGLRFCRSCVQLSSLSHTLHPLLFKPLNEASRCLRGGLGFGEWSTKTGTSQAVIANSVPCALGRGNPPPRHPLGCGPCDVTFVSSAYF